MILSKLETAAMNVISSSLSLNGITGWNVYQQFDFNKSTYPLVSVVGESFQEDNPELNLGCGKAKLIITMVAFKQQTSASIVENVYDAIINPFLTGDATVLNISGSLVSKNISDGGNKIDTATDGWVIEQTLNVVCVEQ